MTVVSDRIARAFNMSGAARAVALDISKTFNRVCKLLSNHFCPQLFFPKIQFLYCLLISSLSL